MSADTKTIKMPADLADNWLAALRSGGYKQGRGRLMTEETTGDKRYCCLGVLQMVADGAVETHPISLNVIGVPTAAWLKAHDIQFLGIGSDDDGNNGFVPDYSAPYVPSETNGLAYINDNGCKSFAEIADLIERHLERT